MREAPKPAAATRDRLVAAMVDALQRRGLHGIGLTELLAAADAPKGVLYHHFPGGKNELAIAAIASAVMQLTGWLDEAISSRAPPAEALRAWMAFAQRRLEKSSFERGCPLATVALESTGADIEIRVALRVAFAAIRARLVVLLTVAGIPEERAMRLAALILAAYEGALMQARVAASVQPLQETTEALIAMIAIETEARS